jgi:hypothetical protein
MLYKGLSGAHSKAAEHRVFIHIMLCHWANIFRRFRVKQCEFLDCFTLKMKAIWFFEKWWTIYRHNIETPLRESQMSTWPKFLNIFFFQESLGTACGKSPWWLASKSLRIHHRIFHVIWSYIMSSVERLWRVIPDLTYFFTLNSISQNVLTKQVQT